MVFLEQDKVIVHKTQRITLLPWYYYKGVIMLNSLGRLASSVRPIVSHSTPSKAIQNILQSSRPHASSLSTNASQNTSIRERVSSWKPCIPSRSIQAVSTGFQHSCTSTAHNTLQERNITVCN